MNESQRQAHVEKWAQSGKTKKAYSEWAGIKYATFISWFNKKKEKLPGRFHRIDSPRSTNELQIEFPNGIVLKTAQELSDDLLKRLKNV